MLWCSVEICCPELNRAVKWGGGVTLTSTPLWIQMERVDEEEEGEGEGEVEEEVEGEEERSVRHSAEEHRVCG